MNLQKQKIIQNYIQAYNNMNVEQIIAPLHEDIVFENISNGTVNLSLKGKEAFKQQATEALTYFSERAQTITSWQFKANHITVEINYKAILAIDFPNGLKVGDKLELKGQSTFTFEDNKIIKIQDKS